MATDRNDQIKTPGKIVWDPSGTPVSIYSSSGWSVELMEDLVTLPSTHRGEHGQVLTGRLVKIEGQATQFTAAALAKLYTHGAVRMGGSIVGSTDKPLKVHTMDGKKRTLACAFVYQEPPVACAAGKTILGNCVIYGILGLSGDPGDLDDLYDEDTETWNDDDWDPAAEITPGWQASWSLGTASKWDDIDSKDPGFVITPRSALTEDKSTRYGLRNVTIQNYSVEITTTAMNISESLVLDAMGRSLRPGQRKDSLGRPLTLQSDDGNAFIRCGHAVLQPGYRFNFNATQHVVENLTWRTFPKKVAGVWEPQLQVLTAVPEGEGGGA